MLKLSSNVVLLVYDSLSISDPPWSAFAKCLLGKSERLLSIIKETILLDKIDDVETDFEIFFYVAHLEEEPLIMSFCVDIVLQNQIISLNFSLSFILENIQQIATLEMWIENEAARLNLRNEGLGLQMRKYFISHMLGL